jgi:hypothetical protein
MEYKQSEEELLSERNDNKKYTNLLAEYPRVAAGVHYYTYYSYQYI